MKLYYEIITFILKFNKETSSSKPIKHPRVFPLVMLRTHPYNLKLNKTLKVGGKKKK
jgi:hypothetical protein